MDVHDPISPRRRAAVVMAVLTAFVACTDDPSLEPAPPETPTTTSVSLPPASPTEAGGRSLLDAVKLEGEIWLVDADKEKLSWGRREIPTSSATIDAVPDAVLDADNPRVLHLAVAVAELLQSPIASDAEAGTLSAIPKGTKLLDAELNGTIALIDLSKEFESGGGSLSMQLRVAQVVYTATQFGGSSPIDEVRILIEGHAVDALGGEGVLLTEAQGRADWLDLAPNVVVTSPRPGDLLESPISIAGHANVFEANVNMRIVAGKRVLAETFTTATCGTGCWGEFLKNVKFRVKDPTSALVEVLTYSAEDGSPQDLVSIPVTLLPG